MKKIDLGFQALLIVKSQVFDKFDEEGNLLPLSDAQTMNYIIVVRDTNGETMVKSNVVQIIRSTL